MTTEEMRLFADDAALQDQRPYHENVRFLQCLLMAMGVVILGFGAGLIVLAASESGCDKELLQDQPCTTAQCVYASARLLDTMNQSAADPCTDFYHYACGGWLSSASIKPGSARWGQFEEVSSKNMDQLRVAIETTDSMLGGQNSSAIRKAKIYYMTCMDEEAIEAKGNTDILQMMDKLGSWTASTANISAWNKTSWSLQNFLTEMHKIGVDAFFGLAIVTDSKDNSKKILEFTQSGLTIFREKYSGEQEEEYKQAFLAYSVKVAVLLGGEDKIARKKMTQVYELEKRLSQIYVSRANETDPELSYNKMTVGDFQSMLGTWINLEKYMTDNFLGRATFSQSDQIIVKTPDYFKKLGAVVEGTDNEVLANYLMWHLISSVTAYLPEAFSKAHLELLKVQEGITSLSPRWLRCLLKVRRSLGMALGALYVEGHFSPSSKSRVESVLGDIKESFISNLQDVKWLDDETREKLKEKAEYISMMVGYPDWILDPKALDERYDKLTIESGQFLGNLIAKVEFERDRELDRFHIKPDKTEWHVRPDDVNAYYNPQSNTIVVPAGILQPPFFMPEYPDSVVYGTIGMIVGHELTHGFDNQGRFYDKYGNMADSMWTKSSQKAFESQVDCMVRQYGNYTFKNHSLNGEMTQGENIADNGGLKFAYQAFQRKNSPPSRLPAVGLSDEQLFYLGFSQIWCVKVTDQYQLQLIETNEHTMSQYRVIGVVQNSPEFSSAFNCPNTAAMNPTTKCQVW